MRDAVDRDRALLHDLEQSRLRLGRGSVDLVTQEQVAEDRAGTKDERMRLVVIHAEARDVRRHRVGRELDAAILEA